MPLVKNGLSRKWPSQFQISINLLCHQLYSIPPFNAPLMNRVLVLSHMVGSSIPFQKYFKIKSLLKVRVLQNKKHYIWGPHQVLLYGTFTIYNVFTLIQQYWHKRFDIHSTSKDMCNLRVRCKFTYVQNNFAI